MKIVHVNYSDKLGGGAAIAAFRLNEALNQLGYDSKMLVFEKYSSENTVSVFTEKSFFKRLLYKLRKKIFQGLQKKYSPFAMWSFAKNGFDISKNQIIKESDVIILHWINLNFLSIKSIEKLLKTGKRIIWFMHDMWPMTGGCHHSLNCNRFEFNCGLCPLLYNRSGSNKNKDISYHLLKEKLTRIKNFPNIEVLTPSVWLAECARRSNLFKDSKITVLHNIINTNIYRPLDKISTRKILNLPLDKKLVLIGADSLTNPYKGWTYLQDILYKNKNKSIEFVIFGDINDITGLDNCPTKIHYLGSFKDDLSLTLLYNACDVFISASIAENYPNVILEAMSCGLPCVAYKIGGIPDLIQHKKTGYLCDEISSDALNKGLEWVLSSDNETLSINSRNWIIENSSYQSLGHNLKNILN